MSYEWIIKQMMGQFLFQGILQWIILNLKSGHIMVTFKYFLTVYSFLLFKKNVYFWDFIFMQGHFRFSQTVVINDFLKLFQNTAYNIWSLYYRQRNTYKWAVLIFCLEQLYTWKLKKLFSLHADFTFRDF